MNKEEVLRERLKARRIAREIHEVTYLKHVTGASEPEIRRAIEKFGGNRSKAERELRRPAVRAVRDSAA